MPKHIPHCPYQADELRKRTRGKGIWLGWERYPRGGDSDVESSSEGGSSSENKKLAGKGGRCKGEGDTEKESSSNRSSSSEKEKLAGKGEIPKEGGDPEEDSNLDGVGGSERNYSGESGGSSDSGGSEASTLAKERRQGRRRKVCANRAVWCFGFIW